MNTILLSGRQVAQHVSMQTCIDLMHAMNLRLAQPAEGTLHCPLRHIWPLFAGTAPQSFLGLMPAASWQGNEARYFGVKCLSVFSANRGNDANGLPSHQGLYVLYDGTCGRPLLLADASEITALRTAANSALALRYLLPTGHSLSADRGERAQEITLGVVGSGEQALRHAVAAVCVMQDTLRPVQRIGVWGRTPEKVSTCVLQIKTEVPAHVRVQSMPLDTMLGQADAVCTVTSAAHPVIEQRMLAPRHTPLLIIAAGACTPTTRELATDVVLTAQRPWVVDNHAAAAAEAGDFLIPAQEGALTDGPRWTDGLLTLPQVIATPAWHNRLPHASHAAIIFKSLGFATQDLWVATYLYQQVKHAPPNQFDFAAGP